MSKLILENKLKDLNEKYFDCYEEMKKHLENNYLKEIRILHPWYTDHGIKHTEAILNTLGDMIAPEYSEFDVRNESLRRGDIPSALSSEDIFVLLSAALWHDVGMLISRGDHARHLINYSSEIKKFTYDDTVTQTIYDIACAHGSNKKFEDCTNFIPLNFYGNDVNVSKKTLAALLRIADEISEDNRRITKTKEVFSAIPDENKVFWEHAASISYSKYKNNRITIEYAVDIDKAFKPYEFPNGRKKTITLYMFIINRICKIINEMIVCAPYFSTICRIDALSITIEFQKQKDWICEEKITEISQDIRPFVITGTDANKVSDRFFELYKNFNPNEIKRKIGR